MYTLKPVSKGIAIDALCRKPSLMPADLAKLVVLDLVMREAIDISSQQVQGRDGKAAILMASKGPAFQKQPFQTWERPFRNALLRQDKPILVKHLIKAAASSTKFFSLVLNDTEGSQHLSYSPLGDALLMMPIRRKRQGKVHAKEIKRTLKAFDALPDVNSPASAADWLANVRGLESLILLADYEKLEEDADLAKKYLLPNQLDSKTRHLLDFLGNLERYADLIQNVLANLASGSVAMPAWGKYSRLPYYRPR